MAINPSSNDLVSCTHRFEHENNGEIIRHRQILTYTQNCVWCYECALYHYNDVIMGAIASQITSLTIVYSTIYSDEDQRKKFKAPRPWPLCGSLLNSPHKWQVTRKMFPFDDVIMLHGFITGTGESLSLKYRWAITYPLMPHIWWPLVQIMVCRLFGAKPLSKPVMGYCQWDP